MKLLLVPYQHFTSVPDVVNGMAKTAVNPSPRFSKGIVQQVEIYLNGHLPLGVFVLSLKTPECEHMQVR